MFVSASRVRRPLGAVLVLAALAAAGCIPQPGDGGGSGTPSCPQRARAVLASDPIDDRQTARAFSPDGTWIATSTDDEDAGELHLSVRRSDGTGERMQVANLVATHDDPVTRIVVTLDGDVRVIGQPVGQEEGLWTWSRSSGQLVQLPPPDIQPPAGRTTESLTAANLSEDGSRAVWNERTVPTDDPTGEALERTVLADSATGDVLGTVEGTWSVLSPDARTALQDGDLVDLVTGARRSLEPAQQAFDAAGMEDASLVFTAVSDGGRYVAGRSYEVLPGNPWSTIEWGIYRWDTVEETLVHNPSFGSDPRNSHLVTDDGRVMYHRNGGAANTEFSIREWNPDAASDVAIDSGMRAYGGPGVSLPWIIHDAPVTSDLRFAAATWLNLFPVEVGVLRVARCG